MLGIGTGLFSLFLATKELWNYKLIFLFYVRKTEQERQMKLLKEEIID